MMLIDARGLRCPWPVLRLARAMRENGGDVSIVADDPIAPGEIAAIAEQNDWQVDPVETSIGNGFLVRR